MNETAKKQTTPASAPAAEAKPEPAPEHASTPAPASFAPPVPEPAEPPASPVPYGYTTRMRWVTLLPKDMVIGGLSLYGRVAGRADTSPNGNDVYWSQAARHYWIGIYSNGQLIAHCRIHETTVGTSQEW